MVAVYSKTFDHRDVPLFRRLLDILSQSGVDVLMYQPLRDFLFSLSESVDKIAGVFQSGDDLPSSTRFFITVGGDGTFLNSIRFIRHSGIPVVGINTGRLGFLSHIAGEDLHESIEKLLQGVLPIEERTLMHTTINGRPVNHFPYSLNDAVIRKNAFGMIAVHTWSNDEFLNLYWADGVIVATPTGSTAYSLSVGGPIVAPNSQNFIISPIAPHNLNVRPLVIPDNMVLRLIAECRDKTSTFILSLDSHCMEFLSGTEIEIRRAEFKVRIVKSASYYTTLRNKLMWGVDKRLL